MNLSEQRPPPTFALGSRNPASARPFSHHYSLPDTLLRRESVETHSPFFPEDFLSGGDNGRDRLIDQGW